MEVLLDTSFIVSCLKKNIDFISQLEEQGFKIRVPKEVLEELKDLKLNVKREERDAIALSFGILDDKRVRKITLGHKKVDLGLIEKGKLGYYIATLDREIKRNVPHRVVIFEAQKKVGPE